MVTHKLGQLTQVVSAIQARWQSDTVLNIGSHFRPRSYLPTGIDALDAAIGGVPVGGITEVMGIPTSGMTTLVNHLIAHTQRQGKHLVYIYAGHDYDADHAVQCGVDLQQLILLRLSDTAQLAPLVRQLVRHTPVSLIVVHLLPGVVASQGIHWQGLGLVVGKSNAALVVLSTLTKSHPLPIHGLCPTARLRLLVQREAWLYQHHDIVGVAAVVSSLKSSRPTPQSVSVTLRFAHP